MPRGGVRAGSGRRRVYMEALGDRRPDVVMAIVEIERAAREIHGLALGSLHDPQLCGRKLAKAAREIAKRQCAIGREVATLAALSRIDRGDSAAQERLDFPEGVSDRGEGRAK